MSRTINRFLVFTAVSFSQCRSYNDNEFILRTTKSSYDLIVIILLLSIIYSQRHLRRFMRYPPENILSFFLFPLSSRLEIHQK